MKSTHQNTSICSARQCKLLLLSNLLSKNQRYSQNNDVKVTLTDFLIVKIDS